MASGTERARAATIDTERPVRPVGRLGPPVALVVSAALFYLGTGLTPVWWLTWLAPLPLLLLAPRVSARRAAIVAAAAQLLGMANYAHYVVGVLEAPLPLVVGLYLVTACVVTGTVVLFRALVRRGRMVPAVLAPPAVWAFGEYLIAVLTPTGSNWTLAVTQADGLPVLQVVSLTGPWGVAFVMLAVAAALGALAAPGASTSARVRPAAVGLVVLLLTVGFGVVQLGHRDAQPSTRVSLVAAARGPGQPAAGTSAGRALIDADLAWLRDPTAGASAVVVFPEKDLRVDDTTLPDVIARFSAAARQRSSTLVLGVEQHTAGAVHNVALAFPPDGGAPAVYRKRYPVPGVEDEVTPGDRIGFAPDVEARVGVAICADLGQVSLGREYGRAGAGMLAVPALDFDVDAWSQSRVQLMRGVENGFSVARASRQGFLTLSDGHGRVLAQATTVPDRTVAVTGDLPVTAGGTLYSRGGDWFAWLCLAVAALGIATLGRASSGRTPC